MKKTTNDGPEISKGSNCMKEFYLKMSLVLREYWKSGVLGVLYISCSAAPGFVQ